MTRYEKLTVVISIFALVISVLTASKDMLARTLGPTRATLSVERDLYLQSRIGFLQLFPYTQIANEGAKDIRLGRSEVDIAFESGKHLKLKADSYIPIDNNQSNFRTTIKLSDVVIGSDKVFSGRLYFQEELNRADEESVRQLEHAGYKSAYENLQAARRAQNKNEIGEPSKEVRLKAEQYFRTRISRVEKGEHVITFQLFDFEGKSIAARKFRMIIFENQIAELSNLFDGWGRWYAEGNVNRPAPLVPVFKLIDG